MTLKLSEIELIRLQKEAINFITKNNSTSNYTVLDLKYLVNPSAHPEELPKDISEFFKLLPEEIYNPIVKSFLSFFNKETIYQHIFVNLKQAEEEITDTLDSLESNRKYMAEEIDDACSNYQDIADEDELNNLVHLGDLCIAHTIFGPGGNDETSTQELADEIGFYEYDLEEHSDSWNDLLMEAVEERLSSVKEDIKKIQSILDDDEAEGSEEWEKIRSEEWSVEAISRLNMMKERTLNKYKNEYQIINNLMSESFFSFYNDLQSEIISYFSHEQLYIKRLPEIKERQLHLFYCIMNFIFGDVDSVWGRDIPNSRKNPFNLNINNDIFYIPEECDVDVRCDEYCNPYYYNFEIDNLESIFNIEFRCENCGILFDSTMSFAKCKNPKHNFSHIRMSRLSVGFDSLINTFSNLNDLKKTYPKVDSHLGKISIKSDDRVRRHYNIAEDSVEPLLFITYKNDFLCYFNLLTDEITQADI
tara:strand:+ start:662 stop:2086 length:1425 start_codon:yes stop_codon:yes gene_type:complete